VKNGQFRFPEFKKRNIRRQSRIVATASYFPENVLTNQDIIQANDLPVTDAVVKKTLGMDRRHVVGEGVADSDLLVEAARRCLESAGLEPDQLTKMLVSKFLGDRILPMTAAIVQKKLQCRRAMHAVDIEGGINSFLYALDLGRVYISTTDDPDQYVLVLAGGIHNSTVGARDPRVAFLFGDGAGAVLLAPSEKEHFLGSYFYTNHEYFDVAGSRALKMDEWVSDSIYEKGDYSLLYNLYRMENWKESIEFYTEAARVTRDNLLRESGLSMSEVDLVLVTENNRKVRDLTLEALGVPEEKSLSLVGEYGNTMSAMLPVLLDRAMGEKDLKEGTTIMLLSHGEGASGGGMLYRV
jgi:3-oxoacyl-[acyl-carrier-protein] synthase-3